MILLKIIQRPSNLQLELILTALCEEGYKTPLKHLLWIRVTITNYQPLLLNMISNSYVTKKKQVKRNFIKLKWNKNTFWTIFWKEKVCLSILNILETKYEIRVFFAKLWE